MPVKGDGLGKWNVMLNFLVKEFVTIERYKQGMHILKAISLKYIYWIDIIKEYTFKTQVFLLLLLSFNLYFTICTAEHSVNFSSKNTGD